MKRPKLLILSCATGNGHHSAGKAVRDAWRQNGGIAVMHDALLFLGRRHQRLVCHAYNQLVLKQPENFGRLYRAGELYSRTPFTPPTYLANRRFAVPMLHFVEKEAFDAILCTHMFPMEAVTRLSRSGFLRVPSFAVMTDYACIPFLSKTDVDYYFSSHPDVTEECVSQGMREERIYNTGIPIAPVFAERLSKEDARKTLEIPLGKRMYLVMTGGMGYGDSLEICRQVVQRDPGSLIYVLCGKNQELAGKIRAEFAEPVSVLPVPFTKDVRKYMFAADLLFTKPGGITSTEACAVGIPLIHTKPIPGIETLNQALFVRNGLSLPGNTSEEAASNAFLLMENAERRKQMSEKQKAFSHPNAAAEIAAIVEEKLKYRHVR